MEKQKALILSIYTVEDAGTLYCQKPDVLNEFLHDVLQTFNITPKKVGQKMFDALCFAIDYEEVDQAFTIVWWRLTKPDA